MSNVGLKVRNKTESQIIDICTRAHDELAEYLGVESTQVFGRTAYWGKDAFHAGLWINQNKHSVLNFRNLYGENVRTMLEIIGHELRHAEQYAQGYMDAPWGGYGRKSSTHSNGKWDEGYWNGKSYSGPYRDAPWEIDARAHEKEYAEVMIKAASITPKELDLVLPGRRVTYYNEHQKKEEFEKNSKERIHWYSANTISKEQDEENMRLRKQEWIDLGMIPPNGKTKVWEYPEGSSRAKKLKMHKEFNDIKKKYKTVYRKDAVAYLTDSQLRACKQDDYWEAQKNILEFDEVELSMGDVTY